MNYFFSSTTSERLFSSVKLLLEILKEEGVWYTSKKILSRLKRILLQDQHILRQSAPLNSGNPYATITPLKPIETHVLDLPTEIPARDLVSFSCITTVKNEESGISAFMESIFNQSLLPKEMIVVDGGSSDNTLSRLEDIRSHSPFPLKVIKSENANIAKGRNIAIALAEMEHIVLVDAGCTFNKDCFLNLVPALSTRFDLVAGIHKAEIPTLGAERFLYNWDKFKEWKDYLPSARILAIKKSLWQKAGGFPEYLSRTGEDTWFDIQYRRFSTAWAFSKHSIAYWQAPTNYVATKKLDERYNYGDGESGMGDFIHYHELVQSFKKNSSPKSEIFEAYKQGRLNRSNLEFEKRNVQGIVVILSGIPFSDSGGGQRCTQLAIEYTRQNYKVIFVNVYKSNEEQQKVYIDIDYSLIEFYSIDDFSLDDLFSRYRPYDPSYQVIAEFPHPFFLPILETFKKVGGSKVTTVYDYLDNWNSSLGGDWYSKEVETKIISLSTHLIASAQSLRDELHSRTRRPVSLIANAVNTRIFHKSLYERPDDLPDNGKKIVTYIGALWGAWFDWKLLLKTADLLPEYNFVLIGEVSLTKRAEIEATAKNIRFLGLKPQAQLPQYLTYTDVTIIPFKTDHITKYVNPLKVYEYLAMQCPVVSSKMDEVAALPGVSTAVTPEEFASKIKDAPSTANHQLMADFIARNNWTTRVQEILKYTNQ